MSRASVLACFVSLSAFCVGLMLAPAALAAASPVFIYAEPGVDTLLSKRIRDLVAQRRAVRQELARPQPSPSQSSRSPEQAANDARVASIRLALERALVLESEASWDACVKEGAGSLGDAVLVLSKVGDLALLRDLHLQIGSCLTLSERAGDASPHFVAAALLDEAPVQLGLRREEAEKAQAAARQEVVSRLRGKMLVDSEPAGADVWIDGKKIQGQTPLSVDVRLGDHYVTLRRFRYEPHTQRTLLQPGGALKIVLETARRETLREQLEAPATNTKPSPREDMLAMALWSRAEQVVLMEKGGLGSIKLSLLDAATAQLIRSGQVQAGADEAAFRKSVCGVLGENCDIKSGGVPWYVWPIAGAALVGGVVSAALIADANREYRFCPSAGCR